ncbi:lysine--tRNA ligase [Candidatus Peregrinibacteria bacterium CG_4_9_14_0_2_um_filter_53_11]|nr:MAG: lysine--tRNA ligase [Candidatus Peregrinibacteria bacterium CG_4_9_14_0_2_um_filter_53_11]
MFWADELVAQIEEKFPEKKHFIIRDEKTASGRVHIGSLRGVVVHGIVAQALREKGYEVEYYYEINDADPMDGLPVYLDKAKFAPHMGKPLKDVPSPDPDVADNFADYFGEEFVGVIRRIGFDPHIYSASTLYEEGKFDHWIDVALDYADEIRQIYLEVSGSEKGGEWNPVQIVCEECGKVGTTTVIGSKGNEGKKIVEYRCEPNKVSWARGCGYIGTTSPYGGRGKLPWKVEWAAKWQIFPVDIEGAGKDHYAHGGSREVAARIAREVFNGVVPFDIPYEFFTFGGSKMSASKGVGASSKEVADMIPPELLRFLMVRTWPVQAIDFDPAGETLPRLFDSFDESAEAYFGRSDRDNTEDLKRVYHFSALHPSELRDVFLPRFSRIAFAAQIPSLDFMSEMSKLKGLPLNNEEQAVAENRREYALQWLERFAPERARFTIQQQTPTAAAELTPPQKQFLGEIAGLLGSNANWEGADLHAAIHELRKNSTIEPRDGFGAIYVALLDKESGPQAGWFLESLDPGFVMKRFRAVAALPTPEKPAIVDATSPLVIITKDVRERFPGIKVGFALLKGVKNSQLTLERAAELREQHWDGLDFEELRKSSARLEAFKDIYRGFGVKPSNNKPSPVALISRLANGRDLPTINTIVDLGNIISVEHQLAVGMFDADRLTLPVILNFAEGGEQYMALGSDKFVPLMPDELCYFDSAGTVMARDFNYLDSEVTKITENSTNLLLNIDGNEASTEDEVRAALQQAADLVLSECGGELGELVILNANPSL